MKPLLVSTTFDSLDEAQKMATLLLEERLVACAQLNGPLQSFYWWNEKIEHSTEYSLTLKTKEELFRPLEAYIKKNHSYDTPEIVATPITHVSVEYETWMGEELSK